jgi:uncharacterized protein (DUF169 family)
LSLDEDIKKAYAIINTKRKIVGVKLVSTEEEYNSWAIKPLTNALSYCVAVKSASLGHRIKINAKTSGCGGSSRVLGLSMPSPSYYNGADSFNLGLYRDKELARECAGQTTMLDRETYGVVVQPIEFFSKDMSPDIVIIISNPRECMRIMQGYSYNYGVTKDISMAGNQGICSELTAYPLMNNTITVSFLCSGTRYLAGWKDDEVAAGMPFAMFSRVIDGVYHTINPIEMDDRKKSIQNNLQKVKIDDLSIQYGRTYYTELEKEKREKRKNEKKKKE